MFPDVVDVEFTAYCNLKCGFCFGPVDDRSVRNLPTPAWRNILTWIKESGAKGIVVSGGEPTLHRDIVSLLSCARALGLSTVMSTHGQFPDRVLKCAEFLAWVAVPVDGVSESMLRQMRGSPWGVPEAQGLVNRLREARPNIGIKLGTVANKQNYDEVPKVGELLARRRVAIDTWKIYQYTARRQFKHRWREYHLEDERFEALRQTIGSEIHGADFDIVFSSNVSRRRAYLFVYPDGTVAIPNVGRSMEDRTVGNVYLEGKSVFDRVEGIISENHRTNYSSTYPDKQAEQRQI